MFLQIILCQFIPMLPRIRLFPLHTDSVQQRYALRRELAVALARIVVCILLARHPLAEGNAIRRGIGDGDIQTSVLLKIPLGCRISFTPLEVIIILFPPDSDAFQPRSFFLLQRAICIGLLLISYPTTQTQAVFGCVGHRHDQIAMFCVILGSCCKAALPLFAEGIPHHANVFEFLYLVIVEFSCSFFGASVAHPGSQGVAVIRHPSHGNQQVTVLGIILLCRRQPTRPRKVVVTIPAHTDTVQSLDLLLSQATTASTAANLPLQLQPRAKA